MAWEKIVKRIGVGGCPKCRNPGFDYQEGSDPHDDEVAAIRCPKCGWKGILRELVIIPSEER
jgi:predicted nucleic-acid-binding Zn-ribbon protein